MWHVHAQATEVVLGMLATPKNQSNPCPYSDVVKVQDAIALCFVFIFLFLVFSTWARVAWGT